MLPSKLGMESFGKFPTGKDHQHVPHGDNITSPGRKDRKSQERTEIEYAHLDLIALL